MYVSTFAYFWIVGLIVVALGITPRSSIEEVNQAYEKLSSKWYPLFSLAFFFFEFVVDLLLLDTLLFQPCFLYPLCEITFFFFDSTSYLPRTSHQQQVLGSNS